MDQNNNNKLKNEKLLTINSNTNYIPNSNNCTNEICNGYNTQKNTNFSTKQAKTFTKNIFNISNNTKTNTNKLFNENEDKIYFTSPPATARNPENIKFKCGSLDFTNKEHMKEFFANKQKINNRLNNMYRESINNINLINSNNSVGQRVLIKNTRGSNVEDRFSKTTKVFF